LLEAVRKLPPTRTTLTSLAAPAPTLALLCCRYGTFGLGAGLGPGAERRTWTISHATPTRLAVTVKRHDHGAASQWLHNSAPGPGAITPTLLHVGGEFVLPQAGHGVSGVGSLSSLPHGFRGLFVAGGIGVTPLFAMVAGLLGRSVSIIQRCHASAMCSMCT
jgi:ferredoxin-NADP reductase